MSNDNIVIGTCLPDLPKEELVKIDSIKDGTDFQICDLPLNQFTKIGTIVSHQKSIIITKDGQAYLPQDISEAIEYCKSLDINSASHEE